jgi:hypothetical protein
MLKTVRRLSSPLTGAAAVAVLIATTGATASASVTIAKVAQTGDIEPNSGLWFNRFGTPSINRGTSNGNVNLAFDHGAGSFSSAPHSIYEFHAATVSGTVFTPNPAFNAGKGVAHLDSAHGASLLLPSANRGTAAPAFAGLIVPSSAWILEGDRVYSNGSLLHPVNPNFEYGKPSSDSGNVAVVALDGSPSAAHYVLLVNGSPTPILSMPPLSLFTRTIGSSSSSFSAAGTSAISLKSTRIAFNGFNVPVNGIDKTGYLTINTDGTGLTVVAEDSTLDPITGSPFNFSTNATFLDRPPTVHSGGAAWTTADGVYAGTQSGANPVKVLDRATNHGIGASIGRHVAGSLGAVAYEVNTAGGTQIWMNQWGKRVRIAGAGDAIGSKTLIGVSIGNEAVFASATPLSTRTGAGYVTFLGELFNDAHPPANGVYVARFDGVGIDLAGRFGGDFLQNNLPFGAPHFFKVRGGGFTGELSTDSDVMTVFARNSLGVDFTLRQEYGSALGVDSGAGDDPLLINNHAGIAEGVSITLDYDVHIDSILFSSLDPGEQVRIGVNNVFTDVTYEPLNPGEVMDGLQSIEMNAQLLPAGHTLTIEAGGVGNGFALSNVILHAVVVPEPTTVASVLVSTILLRRRR